MVPVASAPRVLIAGAGPAGLAAASMLRESGAIVTVLERAVSGALDDASRAGLVVNRSGWNVLRRVGGGSLLEDTRTAISASEHLMSRRAIVESLAAHAEAAGVTIRRGVDIGAVGNAADGVSVALHDAARGADEVLRADWFIDASGGHTALSELPQFERVPTAGPMRLLPTERTFLGVKAQAAPGRGLGWQAADGAFAINNPAEGVAVAYRGGDALPARGTLDDAADELMRSLDLDPSTRIGRPFVFTARQSLAAHAADGRVLLAGDSVGTVMPATQMGTTLALLDAERAARTILQSHGADSTVAAAAVDAYDATTVLMHRMQLR
ncbi:MAG: FAD-dependent monooxygenase [Thermoleophilia bacterium]|nr:FAD-dependent monooxygenase [Thermoleophilia bacterium]